MAWFDFGSPFVAFWVLSVPHSRVVRRGGPTCNQIFFGLSALFVFSTPCDAANTPRETEVGPSADERDREHGMLGGALG